MRAELSSQFRQALGLLPEGRPGDCQSRPRADQVRHAPPYFRSLIPIRESGAHQPWRPDRWRAYIGRHAALKDPGCPRWPTSATAAGRTT